MLGMIRLHQHAAGKLAAAGSAGDLGQKLEHALGGTEIGQAERGVSADNADQGHAVDVVALGDHLRAHQQVDLAGVKAGQQSFHVAAAADGVAIHAADSGVGEQFLQRSSPCCDPAPR